jgi:hypothetical protein
MYLLLLLPPPLNIASTFIILVLWGVAGGCKDWVLDKRKRKIKGFEE